MSDPTTLWLEIANSAIALARQAMEQAAAHREVREVDQRPAPDEITYTINHDVGVLPHGGWTVGEGIKTNPPAVDLVTVREWCDRNLESPVSRTSAIRIGQLARRYCLFNDVEFGSKSGNLNAYPPSAVQAAYVQLLSRKTQKQSPTGSDNENP